ncbi:hypothetical protein Tsubulata_023193 [Turnera subulata]|uniref:Uncharacterized protein n=1 Tax=Turnera subulata TaxID=218843 RepID=A0A9Q0F6F4_9ROSI|nr:hypothetical protein Tsubulata_023193 [Turnera subulata]
MVPAMASEDVKAVSTTIVNLAEEAKLSIEGVKAPSPALLSIAKSLVTGGVAEECQHGFTIPMSFYACERLIRVLRSGSRTVRILKVAVYLGTVLALHKDSSTLVGKMSL